MEAVSSRRELDLDFEVLKRNLPGLGCLSGSWVGFGSRGSIVVVVKV